MMRFGDLEIEFDERVLTPRPWTTRQAQWAAGLMETAPEGPVLELCSGAGQIGLLAISRARRRLVCVDVDPAACHFIETNAARAGLADLVEARRGRLDEVIGADERFAVVIADPPWVPSDRVADYEEDPVLAIDGGPDGLVVAGMCLAIAHRHLLPGGSAVLQLGTDSQAHRVAEAVGEGDLEVVETRSWPGEGVLVHLTKR